MWAWQVKYLFEFDASAVSQIASSVHRVLNREPQLKRYFVALPIDLPAGDTDHRPQGGRKLVSAHTRWTEAVRGWEEAARAKGMEVEFVLLNAHALVTALTEPRHAGRARYWFGVNILSPQWQKDRVDEAIAKAGRRYTPRVNVEVEAGHALDAVGRTGAWVQEWQRALAELRSTRRWPWRAPEQAKDAFAAALPRCASALDEADAALASMITAAGAAGDIPDPGVPLRTAQEALTEIDELLHQHAMSEGKYFVGDAGALYTDARNAAEAIRDSLELARSALTRGAAEKVLLLTGRAGVGETHLLCDAARRRIDDGKPTILVLGQDFDARSLLAQVGELSQLGGPPDDVLGVLDAASEAAGCIGLLMIDALNESERPDRWPGNVRALAVACRRYAHVALVLSCRSEFVEEAIEDAELPRVEHFGFAEATDDAIMRFTKEYGLEPPTFPALNPEFSNPLYLKLTCEALQTLGATRFSFGTAGLTTVTSAFIEAVNLRLSKPGRCNYDKRTDLAGACVSQLAELGRGPWDRIDVQRITEGLLPGREWSNSLLKGLIAEGILIELHIGRIAFGYQRLGDIARASVIAESSADGVQDWLKGLGDEAWSQRGVLGALAVIVPERHGIEIIDLGTDEDGRVSNAVIDSFVESLLLRSPESVTPRAVAVVNKLLTVDSRVSEIWEHLVRIACIPGHPLNAEFLHGHLAAFGLADRDQSWSTWLTGMAEADGDPAVRRLINWAWPIDLASRPDIPDDVAVLAIQLLGWLLTTTDRRVRDCATKAIVSIGEQTPAGLADGLTRFGGVNDPYVTERLAAAACGVVLRTESASATALIADAVDTLLGDDWPLHLLTRDYARRVFAVASTRGWHGPQRNPPYGAQWPVQTRTTEEIEQLVALPDHAYRSIWHSLTEMGDFGRYILQPSLDDVESADPQALLHDAERTIFDRVLNLGWTPERFREIDSRRGWSDDNPVERVGKKYQWIGFYEVLGRITDNNLLSPSWNSTQPQAYQYPEQLTWRDIDPTVLARTAASLSLEQLWFSPAKAHFPEGIAADHPDDMLGIPDPLDLIAVRAPEGASWLTLAGHPSWQQQVPPETEALGTPRREAWMHVTAYLVPVSALSALREWAQGKDWHGRWMPEGPEIPNVLLGAYPDDPQWYAADGSIEHWNTHRGPMPEGLTLTAAGYAGTGTSRDASTHAETTGWVPSRRLNDALGLTHGKDFTWNDASGTAIQDPSPTAGGPTTLIMRYDLLPQLTGAGLSLFWTVLIGNELNNTDITSHPGSEYRWVSASASYVLSEGTINLISANAARYAPGPRTERTLNWTPRQTDR